MGCHLPDDVMGGVERRESARHHASVGEKTVVKGTGGKIHESRFQGPVPLNGQGSAQPGGAIAVGARDGVRAIPIAGFMTFNVTYEDGSVTSNRRVSNDLLDQSFGESIQDLARTALEDQDNEIAQRSGRRRAKIKSIIRV